ncbi:MAG: hypothetical protein MJE63_30410 [Proteobacteria bacterium]|nr:hypothetical protein [Pseudomonadota bacterium]
MMFFPGLCCFHEVAELKLKPNVMSVLGVRHSIQKKCYQVKSIMGSKQRKYDGESELESMGVNCESLLSGESRFLKWRLFVKSKG